MVTIHLNWSVLVRHGLPIAVGVFDLGSLRRSDRDTHDCTGLERVSQFRVRIHFAFSAALADSTPAPGVSDWRTGGVVTNGRVAAAVVLAGARMLSTPIVARPETIEHGRNPESQGMPGVKLEDQHEDPEPDRHPAATSRRCWW